MEGHLSNDRLRSQDLELEVASQDGTVFDHPLAVTPKLRVWLLGCGVVVVPLSSAQGHLIRAVTVRDQAEEHIHLFCLLQFHIIKSMLHATSTLKVGMIIGELDAVELSSVRQDHLHSYPRPATAGHRHRKYLGHDSATG